MVTMPPRIATPTQYLSNLTRCPTQLWVMNATFCNHQASWCDIHGFINGHASLALVSMWISMYPIAMVPYMHPIPKPIPNLVDNNALCHSIRPPFMGMSTEWYATPTRVVVTRTSDSTVSLSVSLGNSNVTNINPKSYGGRCAMRKQLSCKIDQDTISYSVAHWSYLNSFQLR